MCDPLGDGSAVPGTRSERIRASFNNEEMQAVEEAAESLGLPPATYLRMVAVRAARDRRAVTTIDE